MNQLRIQVGMVFLFLTQIVSVFGTNAPGVTVAVDPVVALTNYTGMGEWNTNGNFENWTTVGVSGAVVSGGMLSGTASGSNPQFKLTGVAGGPDLDLAYNDYMDIRLQLPAGFGGPMQVYYGATNQYFGTSNSITGFISTNRVVTITNLATDGAFHVYRIFWGPDIYWRGNLSDVRVDPLGTNATVGQAFAVDYVRVGDLAGEIYTNSITATRPAGSGVYTNTVTGLVTYAMESKHFRFLWDASSISNSAWTATMPHGTLRNFEECYKNHVWRMGFRDPCYYQNKGGVRFRISVTSYFGGYWMGGDENGVVALNMTPDGLRVEPPTWVPPHEFGHGCQGMANTNGTSLAGHFWENNANYDREQWLYNYPWAGGSAAAVTGSGLVNLYSANAHWWIGMSRSYYECWPFWLYMDENPDNLPGLGSAYGNFSSTRVWKEALPGEYIWDTMTRLWPSLSLKDFIGGMARRNVMWDYANRKALTNSINADGYDPEWVQKNAYVELRQRPDDPSWWQVPPAMAPQQSGYNIIKLVPQGSGAGRVVSVNFHGLADNTRGADWRASLVVVNSAAAVRYSSMWNAGTTTVTLAANENTVYLVVAGTPDHFLAEDWDDLKYPYQSSAAKQRFPYEVQVAGAVPFESTNSTVGLVQLSAGQGGGWRSLTAVVDVTAYVGPNARVLGNARVRGNAKILDYAVVKDSAVVTNNAVVSGHALVRGYAVVRDNAKVRDYAVIGQAYYGSGTDTVSGNARALEYARFDGSAIITNWATAKGCAFLWHDNGASTGVQGSGDVVLDGDYLGALSPTNGFEYGSLPYSAGVQDWISVRSAPRRVYAAYEFVTANDSLAKDYYGTTDGYLQGNPTWLGTDGTFSGFIGFNGTNQYVILDRSLSDLPEITVTAWVRWSGGAGNQPVWYFGTASTNCMYLTPDDGTGHAKFSIIRGGVPQTLSAPNVLPIGVWTHVTLSLSNAVTGRLYINGTNVATGSVTIQPDQLNAPNANTNLQQNYLARGTGSTLPYFNGYLDSVRVYTGPLTDAEIAALALPPTPPTPKFSRNISPTNGLLFSAVTESFPVSGNTGDWPTYSPTGQSLAVLGGGPTVAWLGSVPWEWNANPDGGYVLMDPAVGGYYANPVPIGSGVTVVAAVQPVRTGTSSPAFDFVVSLFHQRVCLGVDNYTGQIIVFRNGSSSYGPVISNNQKTILSLVVQNNGTYVVYTNGVQAKSVATMSSLNGQLNPDLTQDNANWGADQSWTHYICVGREYPDGWSSYNGYIGDVFVYTNALTTTEREALEADLMKKFITPNTPPTISAIGNLGVTIPVNGNSGALGFTVSDAETPAGSLILDGSSSNPTLLPNGSIIFGGSRSNRTVTVTPAANQSGTATVTASVSDGGLVSSSQFTVNVVQMVAMNSTNITYAAGGGNITLTWPADHTGWWLQSQTSTPSVGLSTNWVNVPGSNQTNSMVLPMDVTKDNVFYRLIYQ